MRKSLLALGVVAAVSAVPAQAEYLFGFGGMYVDYQAWNHGFGNDKDNFGADIEDRNQAVIGIEGGAVFDWGQIYGFYDYEGVDRAGDDRGVLGLRVPLLQGGKPRAPPNPGGEQGSGTPRLQTLPIAFPQARR